MADPGSKVGSNYLIVENIVKYCDVETKKSCRLVNKMWEEETCKYVWLRTGAYNEDYEPDPRFVALLDKGGLNEFNNLKIYNVVHPQLLDYFGSSLKSLQLRLVYFRSIFEMEVVLFDNFPNMKVLTLDRVGVKKQSDRVRSRLCAFIGFNTAEAKLDALNIVIGDRCYWKGDTEPGVLVLGLDTLFYKFNKIKKLKLKMGDYSPHPDVFAALSRANLAPLTLQYHSWSFTPDSMANYLTKYGASLLHLEAVIDSEESDMERFKNVKVASWLNVRIDRANWNTFGRGTFENLQRLQINGGTFESFDFLCRMPVLREIKFVERDDEDGVGTVEMVTALDRNPPCKTVTTMDIGENFADHAELYFHVFPNLTQVNLSCYEDQLPEIVSQWPMLTKLHFWKVDNSDAAEVTRNVVRLEALEDFMYGSEDLTFGDAEGEEFLFHPKLTYLRLWQISMSPLMVRLLKRKLVVFEFVYLNGVEYEPENDEVEELLKWLDYF